MCLSIPARVISIKGNEAEVSAGGAIFRAGLDMVENVKVGDYILLHVGFAIQIISDDEAEKTIRLFEELHISIKGNQP